MSSEDQRRGAGRCPGAEVAGRAREARARLRRGHDEEFGMVQRGDDEVARMDDADMERERGRRRAIIEGVRPQIDGGRFAAKRTVGEDLVVGADIFTDGHDALSGRVRYRREGDEDWEEVEMEPVASGNDRWEGRFSLPRLGRYEYTVVAWVDHFKGWRRDLKKRVAAEQDIELELVVGAEMVAQAAARAEAGGAADVAQELRRVEQQLRDEGASQRRRADLATSEVLWQQMNRWPDRSLETRLDRALVVQVDRVRARFSSWYELFPRSLGAPGEHGTFADVEAQLPRIEQMGFDVLYLPPIHPIGRVHRKGKNNARQGVEGDVGSPWAIGAQEGGHEAIHPELGTPQDFRRLVSLARDEHGIEIAMDIAFQVAPDHPWVEEHPEWFKHLPDGTIRYAENPPKKYEDIYPFDFETPQWRELWQALEGVVRHWCEQGVRVFRVDNPHTKPFDMWEWIIGSIRADYPEAIFLAEAFTRPKIMYRLAKLGFSQSYTYFAWRNTADELRTYLQELNREPVCEFFRPNFWPNTPDILTEFLQFGGRPAFLLRVALASTLSSSYGIYGPAYEFLEHTPREHGSEEYLDSEKYQLRDWSQPPADNITDYITRLNAIRHEHPALQRNDNLSFHHTDNDQLLAFSKVDETGDDVILVVANLDPYHRQAGWVDLDLDSLALQLDRPFQVHDLLGDARYLWHGPRNYVELDPQVSPVHVFRVGQRVRREQDFEYFL